MEGWDPFHPSYHDDYVWFQPQEFHLLMQSILHLLGCQQHFLGTRHSERRLYWCLSPALGLKLLQVWLLSQLYPPSHFHRVLIERLLTALEHNPPLCQLVPPWLLLNFVAPNSKAPLRGMLIVKQCKFHLQLSPSLILHCLPSPAAAAKPPRSLRTPKNLQLRTTLLLKSEATSPNLQSA